MTDGAVTLRAFHQLRKRLSVRATLFSEHRSRCVRTEQCFVEAPVMHLPMSEAEDGAAQRTAGIAVGEGSPHFLFAAGHPSAEFAVLKFWAAKPASMPWEEAGATGTSVETANQAFIAQLGATPTTYGPGLPERVRALQDGRVDLALDVAGAGSLPELIAITGGSASVVTIADFTAPRLRVRLSLGDLGGEPNGHHGLGAAVALFEKGRFRLPLQAVFPMTQAARAHALAAQGPRQGKIALTVPRS